MRYNEVARIRALAMANEARHNKSRIKKDLQSQTMTLDEVLDSIETEIGLKSATVVEILGSIPKMGPKRSRHMIKLAGISDPLKKLGELTERQTSALRTEYHNWLSYKLF